MKKLLVSLFMLVCLVGCYPSSANKEDVKMVADKVFKQAGYEPIGYLGYLFGTVFIYPFNKYGGACVYYSLKRVEAPGIMYEGCIQRWGDEYHIYGVEAVDAIKPAKQ